MIDRKAFRISGLILLAMIAATLWRLSLLPDWRLPVGGPGSHNTVNGLFLFAQPVSVLFMMGVPVIRWLTSSEETRPSWRRWNEKWLVTSSVLMAMSQAFTLACSLGLVSLPALGRGRLILVWMGITFMIVGNAAPKTPILPQRASFELDSWQQSRLLRFAGKLMVGLGLAFVLGGILLPLEWWRPVFFCLMLAALVAGIWHGLKLRRELPPAAPQNARPK